jgi:hypothetical protein
MPNAQRARFLQRCKHWDECLFFKDNIPIRIVQGRRVGPYVTIIAELNGWLHLNVPHKCTCHREKHIYIIYTSRRSSCLDQRPQPHHSLAFVRPTYSDGKGRTGDSFCAAIFASRMAVVAVKLLCSGVLLILGSTQGLLGSTNFLFNASATGWRSAPPCCCCSCCCCCTNFWARGVRL